MPEATFARVGPSGSVRVPHALFGNFFEHMGAATASGAHAELLVNHTFSRRHHLSPEQLGILRANGELIEAYSRSRDARALAEGWHSTVLFGGFGAAVLDDGTDDGFPLPWASAGGRVAPSVGRVGHAVRVSGEGDGAPGGIRQAVFPPAHRIRELRVSGTARATAGGNGRLEVAIERRSAERETIARSELGAISGGRWQPFSAEVRIDGQIERGEPVDIVVRWLAPEGVDVLIDHVSAMPPDAMGPFDPDIVAAAAGRTPELRWPGGNFASFYRWRDGVGPVADRPTLENQAWGGLEYNMVGTDEYIALCRKLGAEPHITVNAGTGTAEEAAAWVEYCNGAETTPMGSLRAANGHPEPYDVRIWEIGNELWGEFQGGNIGGELNAQRFAEFARAMRAASTIRLRLLATGNWFDLVDTDDPRLDYVSVDGCWQSELLRLAPDEVDAVSMHWLPFASGFFPEDPSADEEVDRALLAQLVTAERTQLPRLRAEFASSARDPGLPPIEIALTEWCPVGSLPNERARRFLPDNAGSVVWGAACLNTFIRASDFVTSASPNGWLHGGCLHKTAGVVFADPSVDLQNRYLELFAGGTVLPVDISGAGYDSPGHPDLGLPEMGIPWLDVLAVRTAEGLAGSIVNRDGSSARRLELALPPGSPESFRCWTMVYRDIGARRTFAEPDALPAIEGRFGTRGGILTMDVPPHAVILFASAATRA